MSSLLPAIKGRFQSESWLNTFNQSIFQVEIKNRFSENMNRQSAFYYLTKLFGIAPFSNNQVVSRNRQWLNDLLLISPTSIVCVFFIGSLFSIFYHSGSQSETSNITNWLQVHFLVFHKNFCDISITRKGDDWTANWNIFFRFLHFHLKNKIFR